MLCHGDGAPEVDGCCWVNGQVCPLRLKLESGRVYEGPELVDRGPVSDYVKASVKGKPNQDRVLTQLEGVRFACRAATDVLANDGSLLNNRAGFEAAWNTHADYVAQVRPHWATIEQTLGMAEGEYQCSTFRGVGGKNQCCFAEDLATNDTKAASLHADARNLRQAGGS